MKGSEALEKLLEGNRRFAQGGGCLAVTQEALAGMARGQRPSAAVLCCADSRVGPEHILDQGLGDIFVVRVAGNIAGISEIGSLEYAVKHLGVPLLMVLGHEECGAVKAALEGEAPGAIGELVQEIGKAVLPVLDQEEEVKDVVFEAVRANVWHTMAKLIERSPVISDAVRNGSLMLTGAVYSLSTGRVTILKEEG